MILVVGNTRREGLFGLDILLRVRPDNVANLGSGLPIESNSVDCVHANHFLEHIENLDGVLSEIHRVFRPDGHVSNIIFVTGAPSMEYRWKCDQLRKG